jgi:hypothetical protein
MERILTSQRYVPAFHFMNLKKRNYVSDNQRNEEEKTLNCSID